MHRCYLYYILFSAIALSGCTRWSSPLDSTDPLRRAELIELLQRIRKDEDARSFRGQRTSVDFKIIPDVFWYCVRPDHYARERLIARGVQVVDPLLELIADSSQPRERILSAISVLAVFDDERILPAVVRLAVDGRLQPDDLRVAIGRWAPVPDRNFPQGSDEEIVGWAQEQLGKRTTAQFVLRLLTRTMENEPVGAGDWIVMRWFNRTGAYDLDEWLGRNYPEALEFRNRQRRLGYDPLGAMMDPLWRCHQNGVLSSAAAAIYLKSEDQAGCRALFKAVGMMPGTSGYHEWQLIKWWYENRDTMIYDRDKHCFVERRSPG